jgi:hypothetical protein
LTKHSTDEITVKCNITLNQADKVRPGIPGVLDKNARAICSNPIRTEVEMDPQVKLIVTRKEICKTRLEKTMSEIHDIENGEREKPVKIELDIDLYQMEEP